MNISFDNWEYTLITGDPEIGEGTCLAVADIDGDGKNEIIVGGSKGLAWLRLDNSERGWITGGNFSCGLFVADIDGDGRMEVCVSGKSPRGMQVILWCKRRTDDMQEPWDVFTVEPDANGGAHDLLYNDIDGDGEMEIVANAAYCDIPGLYVYKRADDPRKPWTRFTVDEGCFTEGIAAADLDSDGRIELVHGPYWFRNTGAELSGPWERHIYAPPFREMSRVAVVDITGNGVPDIAICESEYPHGRFSWYENRLPGKGSVRAKAGPGEKDSGWIEHELLKDVNYGHSLSAHRDGGAVRLFNAEMAAGGWERPLNPDARVFELISRDNGKSWALEVHSRGDGTHQAVFVDADSDGEREVVGKVWGKYIDEGRLQLWKRSDSPSIFDRFQHTFIDRDKPSSGIDIVAADVTGGGTKDVFCGSYRYRCEGAHPGEDPPFSLWSRSEIPGRFEIINAYDVDGDGLEELIALKRLPLDPEKPQVSATFTSELYWLKAVVSKEGREVDQWQSHYIGKGHGDWVHGSVMAPFLPGGRPALVAGYHSAHSGDGHFPEIFRVPDVPSEEWPKSVLVDIPYGEEFLAVDLTGSGMPDIIAGNTWLENGGDGGFAPYRFGGDFYPARIRALDITGNGRLDVVMGKETVDWNVKKSFHAPLVWCEQPEDPREVPWPMHVIDKVRCPHSIGAADLDGDGEGEIVVGEHDPFDPYRSRCRLFVYKKADPRGRTWKKYTLDDRFEHHDGAKVYELEPGRLGIFSHGWRDSKYVHLWTLGK